MREKPVQLTALIERDDDWFVATCPEVDVISQGKTVEEARANLLEAVELFFEAASPSDTVPVPDHEELRTGTLLGIIRQSGLPRSAFESR